MKAAFIESPEFTEWVSDYLPDENLSALQEELMKDPAKGAVMSGCGGLRKVRIGDVRRGQGKRGGARVIYLYVPEAKRFYLIDIYGKDEKDDLNADEKKAMARIAADIKQSAQPKNPS